MSSKISIDCARCFNGPLRLIETCAQDNSISSRRCATKLKIPFGRKKRSI